MTSPLRRMTALVIGWQALFALGTAMAMALVPRLMLLEDSAASQAARGLLSAIALGSLVSAAHTVWLLSRHRELLGLLATPNSEVPRDQLRALSEDVFRVTFGFLMPPLLLLVGFCTILKPPLLEPRTAWAVGLLGIVFVSATSLPLHVVLRGVFLRAVELASPDTLSGEVAGLESSGLLRRRTQNRLLLAVTLPVAFVAIGAALIVNSHVRRAEERVRQDTARALAQVAFDMPAGTPGLETAVERARRFGFAVRLFESPRKEQVTKNERGVVTVSMPLARGGAQVHFDGSVVEVLSLPSVALVVLALLLATVLGGLFSRAVSRDLAVATRGIRDLGTESAMGGATRVMRPARFEEIRSLGRAIEQLADRFRVFARAQERAIAARERAARLRGMFFASVSHDLKSPLNAILGFTEIVRQTETLSEEQLESIDVIDRSGRELLALIETILDAARVEAGGLELMRERVSMTELVSECVAKGYDLGGGRAVEVVAQIREGVPDVYVDRTRMSRALATLVGHAVRTAERDYARMRVLPSRTGGVRIDLEVPSTRVGALELAALLDEKRAPGRGEHRGLALALGLVRAIIVAHGGSINVADRGEKGSVLTVRLPARDSAGGDEQQDDDADEPGEMSD